MNIRKIIRNTIFESLKPRVSYSAVVIEDPVEIAKIQDVIKEYVPENKGWRKPHNFHMTISVGPIPESLYLRGDLNKEVELKIDSIGMDSSAIALGTFGYYSKNDIPHITIAFNKYSTPAASKVIKNWKPIDEFYVTGVIREVADGNVIIKENINKDKIIVDFDNMNIMLGNKIVGVFYMYNHRKGKYLTLNKIEIIPEYKGLGYATEAMRQIVDYANKNNLITVLTPDSYKGSNVNRLIKWYKSLGFVMNKGKNKDFETMQLMYKLPDS